MGNFLGSISAVVIGVGLGAASVGYVVDTHPEFQRVNETHTVQPAADLDRFPQHVDSLKHLSRVNAYRVWTGQAPIVVRIEKGAGS